MIISRTPLRMSFVGGGSDIPSFYRRFGGAVLSTAVDKYIYVTVNRKFDDSTRVSYSRTEEVKTRDEIQHPLVRESMKLLRVRGGIEITSIADIPSKGTGLGSSSSFTVGLLHALHAFRGRYASADQLAKESCDVELNRCGEPIGKQDQYAAAFGGLNLIEFREDDSVQVSPITCARETVRTLESNVICFYTGLVRSASAILKNQQSDVVKSTQKQKTQKRMVGLAYAMRKALQQGQVDGVGELLHENWMLKKSLSAEISSDQIDAWYRRAREDGALGGKILGAGSGGFLMFYAPKSHHDRIERGLRPLRKVGMAFEPLGSRIIFVHE